MAVLTVQKLLSTKVDHAALVDFADLVKVTGQVGGVTVNNSHAFSSHGFSYPLGRVTLSGNKALWFIRGGSAPTRRYRDQAANSTKVLLGIVSKGLSGPTIRHPAKFTRFVAGVAGSLTVDNGLTDANVRKLALSLRLTPGDVRNIGLPLGGRGTEPHVGAVDLVDQQKITQLSAAIHDDDLARYVRKTAKR